MADHGDIFEVRRHRLVVAYVRRHARREANAGRTLQQTVAINWAAAVINVWRLTVGVA